MSDEREGAGSADTGAEPDSGHTAVVTRPPRPTGKRSRRGAVTESQEADSDEAPETDSSGGGDDGGSKGGGPKKTARRPKDGPSRNPFAFVLNYLQEVIGELRKVIWPNRKQMVTYTTVVLLFLAFMVALIGFTDLGLARLVMMVFG
ncbi:Protein translocase subunit SecE [Mycolicibacterium vanbaalenii]|uniref:Protein translocase subunit SecE n=1 Tax=Mycolicibacterium vanbaalenii TaxID=110539 RepID=A0A5S9R6A8_MYCVN|nr:preprotein translocase subunit SecE [Mycolicibacterium vanbaalenii]CAA0130092.1 Protein translocase subunit SecE [Mycolicibacterium vanbaalenii]